MLKRKMAKLILISGLSIAFVLMIYSLSMVAGPINSFSEVQEKLTGISDEERKVLQDLFLLVQEAEEMEREEKGIIREIEIIRQDIEKLKLQISDEENTYQKKRNIVKEILRSYQRMGPGSYLEAILGSDNLTMFLRNINILRDFTSSTKKLLESLEESSKRLAAEKAGLDEKLLLMKDKQESQKKALTRKLQLKDDKEKYLASLENERKYYQEHLSNLEKAWEELKLLFAEVAVELSLIIEEGDLPWDDLKITYTLNGIKGNIDEKTFNKIMKGYPRLPEMEFIFLKGRAEIKVPKKNLILKGVFVVQDEQTIKFETQEGSFYGMPLESSAIAELFREGYLGLNLKPLLGRSIIESVDVTEGNMELNIKLVLF